MDVNTIITTVANAGGDTTSINSMLEFCNTQYRIGTPIISDQEYDHLLSLSTMEDGNPTLMDYVHNDKPLLSLPVTMGSLNKLKTSSDLTSWFSKLPNPTESLIITPKYDGISVCIEVINDGGYVAYTRGTGTKGFDISEFVHLIGIPPLPPGIYCGEIVLTAENLQKLNILRESTGLPPYKNSRNTVAGLLSTVTPDPEYLPYLSIVLYGIPKLVGDKWTQISYLKGIQDVITTEVVRTSTETVTPDYLNTLYSNWKTELGMDIDGVVIDVDSYNSRCVMTSTTLNPGYAMAWKGYSSDVQYTTVTAVNRTPNKDGIIIPTLSLDPVTIGGVTISSLLADSESFLYLYGIGVGTTIGIIRSGDVIPRIVMVEDIPVIPAKEMSKYKKLENYDLDRTRTKYLPSIISSEYTPPTEYEYSWDSTSSHIVLTEESEITTIKSILWFFQEIGVKGVSLATITTLYHAGYTTVRSLYCTSIESLALLPGWGHVSAKKFKTEIHSKLSNATPSMIMSASNCFYKLGEKKLAPLVPYLELSNSEFETAISTLSGIRKVTKDSIMTGLPKYREFYDTIKEFIIPTRTTSPSTGTKYVGQKFVFTGIRDRDLESYIKAQGGMVVSGVSSTVTGIITVTPDSMSSKILKAKKLGIPIISYHEMKASVPTINPTTLF